MTDLHTHILPGMDDGAKTPEDARELMELELENGVTRIALTSHFSIERETEEEFLLRRESGFRQLLQVAPAGLELKRGCEVYYSPAMLHAGLKDLCLEGTNILLLELPLLTRPPHLEMVLEELQIRGIVPLIAHVERYAYVRRDPRLLARWIGLGALIQVNAQSVIDSDALVRRLLRWGLVQVVASDAHSAVHRPPNLGKAMERIAKQCGAETVRTLQSNARAIFQGETLQAQELHIPKRFLGFWV